MIEPADTRTENQAEAVVESLFDNFVERLRNGESPSIEDEAAANPHHADLIRELFPVLLTLEKLKPTTGELSETTREPAVMMPAGAPDQLGPYRVLEEIGRGGMGVVYRAEHQSLGRMAALKVLPTCSSLSPQALDRFRLEARAAARLHHTNIVPVFGVGEHEGLHYYAMQFISGRALDQVLDELEEMPDDEHRRARLCPDSEAVRERGSYWRRVAELVYQLTRAVHFAHSRGVMHRDIKPANVLLDEHGTAWVADFGLAKLIDAEGPTRTGDVVGTLRYMAPEQLDGGADARTDVFGLGLVLYELLCIVPARTEADRGPLLRQIQDHRLDRPRTVRPEVPRDLETIALCALAHDPARRYQSAAALGEDLRRWLDELPIRARRIGAIERTWRWCKRKPALAALSATALGLLVCVAVVASYGYWETQTALAQARAERGRAEDNLRLALKAFGAIFDTVSDRPIGRPLETGGEGLAVVSPEVARILEQLLGFYDQFAEKNSDDTRLARDMASAHRRVGEVLRRLGRHQRAEAAFRRALELEAGLRRGDWSLDQRARVAALYRGLGEVLLAVGQRDEGRQAFDRAREAIERGSSRPPASQLELARVYYALARSERNEVRPYRPDSARGKAIALLRDLHTADPANPEVAYFLALAQRGYREGDHRAIDLLERLVRDYPQRPDYRYELSETLARTAGHRRGDGRRHTERLRRAVALSRELVERHPGVPDYRALKVRNHLRQALRLVWTESYEAAEVAYRWALREQDSLSRQYPAVAAYRTTLATIRLELAGLLRVLGRDDDALALLQRALLDFGSPHRDDRAGLLLQYKLTAERASVLMNLATAPGADADLTRRAREASDHATELRAALEAR